jgi:hypothetical protein
MFKRVSMLLLVLLGVMARWCIALAGEKLPKPCCAALAHLPGRAAAP